MRTMTKVALATVTTIGLTLTVNHAAGAATHAPPTTNVVRSETITQNGITHLTCPDCVQKNLQGGNGSGFVFGFVQFSNGQCAHEVTAVNKDRFGIDATVMPYATVVLAKHGTVDQADGAPLDRKVFLVPAHQPGPDVLYVKMVDAKGHVIIGGNGPNGTKPVSLDCPCPTTDETTTTVATPSTSTPASTSSVPGSSTVPPTSSSPGTTNVVEHTTAVNTPQGTLPQTGNEMRRDVTIGSLIALVGVGLLLLAGRRRGAEEKM